MAGIIDIAGYVPRGVLPLSSIATVLGSSGGRGQRSVANFDEDTTTMAVAAARALAPGARRAARSVWFGTTAPAYLYKTNATTVHAALHLDPSVCAFDAGPSLRSGVGAMRAAYESHGIAVLADMWGGLPGGDDERNGADAAAAIAFGPDSEALAVVESWDSCSLEVLERWGLPGASASQSWDDRFGAEALGPIIKEFVGSRMPGVDHVVVSSVNNRSASVVAGTAGAANVVGTTGFGFAGTADVGLKLVAALKSSQPAQKIVLVVVADGLEVVVLKTTDKIGPWQDRIAHTSAFAASREVAYADMLSWRGRLPRQTPRRPEPQAPAAPPSFRSNEWKFALHGTKCTECGRVHAPPTHKCRTCGAVGAFASIPLADLRARVVTFTVDNLAYTPAPPMILAVVDFGNGARSSFEVADTQAGGIAIGDEVELVFRRVTTAEGVHNYFWKVRPIAAAS